MSSSSSSMLGIRCRRHTCKIILITSLIWCFLDLLVLMTYSDCSNGIGFACGSASSRDGSTGGQLGGKRKALKFAKEIILGKEGFTTKDFNQVVLDDVL